MKKFITVALSTLLVSLLYLQVFAQNNSDSIKPSPEFKNQGEQEVYWAKKLFQNNYKEQLFKKFPGRTIANGVFIFSRDSLIVYNTSPELKAIFPNGLLYPALIGGNRISDIEEMKFLEKCPQQRRFKFLLYLTGLSNPIICFFELTDKHATQVTPLDEFIRDARLTFFKQGWVMI